MDTHTWPVLEYHGCSLSTQVDVADCWEEDLLVVTMATEESMRVIGASDPEGAEQRVEQEKKASF